MLIKHENGSLGNVIWPQKGPSHDSVAYLHIL
jgi:hypothetical protein